MDFAVIETGGKQYKVSAGQKLRIEKIAGEKGAKVSFGRVLLRVAGGRGDIGGPYVKGAAVEAEVLEQARDDKKTVFRYHSKTRYRKLRGHRQPLTKVLIASVR